MQVCRTDATGKRTDKCHNRQFITLAIRMAFGSNKGYGNPGYHVALSAGVRVAQLFWTRRSAVEAVLAATERRGASVTTETRALRVHCSRGGQP